MLALLTASTVEPDPVAVAAAGAAHAQRGPLIALTTAAQIAADRAAEPPPALDPRASTRTLPAGPALRVITPAGRVRALRVTAHRGGWCTGTPQLDDTVSGLIADAAGIATVSVDYRLAPEHPHPAGVQDIVAALRWAIDEGCEELGCVRMVAAGASAGAHLMALAVLALRDQRPGAMHALAGLELRYGCYDLALTPSLRAAPEAAGMAALIEHLGPAPSPLHADLHGLAPTLLSVGDRDGVYDDSAFLAMRLAAAGVPVELDVWAGCPHVFDGLSADLADEYAGRVAAWLARARTIR